MDATATLILIGFLLFFAVIIYLMFRSSRKDKQRKQELAQTLGFVPAEITPELTARFTQLYERQGIEKMDPQFKPNDPERMNERINRALEIFNVLRSKP